MTTSSNGNIFRVTGPLCGEFTGPGEFPTQRPVTRSFDVFFDLRLNKPLSKQSWGWSFGTLTRSLWRHSNDSGCWADLKLKRDLRSSSLCWTIGINHIFGRNPAIRRKFAALHWFGKERQKVYKEMWLKNCEFSIQYRCTMHSRYLPDVFFNIRASDKRVERQRLVVMRQCNEVLRRYAEYGIFCEYTIWAMPTKSSNHIKLKKSIRLGDSGLMQIIILNMFTCIQLRSEPYCRRRIQEHLL